MQPEAFSAIVVGSKLRPSNSESSLNVDKLVQGEVPREVQHLNDLDSQVVGDLGVEGVHTCLGEPAFWDFVAMRDEPGAWFVDWGARDAWSLLIYVLLGGLLHCD